MKLIERGAPIAVEDEESHRVYFLVDPTMFDSLRSEADMTALLAGIADADAGRTAPLDEATQRIEARLKARFAS